MALLFNGTTNCLSLGDVLDFATSAPLSICAWVRRAATGVRHDIISKDDAVAADSGYTMFVSATNFANFGNFNGARPFAISTTTLSANTTYHVCGVYDAGASLLRMFINGVQEDTTASGAAGLANALSLQIGRQAGAGIINPFNGELEDVRVYDRALTADEVLTIYTARGLDHIIFGLVGRWTMATRAPLEAGFRTNNVQSTSETTASTTITLAYTVPSAVVDPVLVVCVGGDDATIGDALPTAATFGATSMTLRASSNTTATAGRGCAIFTLAVTAGDSQTITGTLTGTCSGRDLVAFVVSGASDAINGSGSAFNNAGNSTTGFTSTVVNRLGIICLVTAENAASTGVTGTNASLLTEVLSGGTTFSMHVITVPAVDAQAYTGYGASFAVAPNRSSCCAIGLDDSSSSVVPDMTGTNNAVLIGAQFTENIALDSVA